jgi:hypothetical protein
VGICTVPVRLPPSYTTQKNTPWGLLGANRESEARVSTGIVLTTNKLPAKITAVEGGGEPQAATTERLRSRKLNKRPPRWRRLQLAEPTGKAKNEAAARPIGPRASRQAGGGAGPRSCPGGPRWAPPAGSRSAPGVYTLSFRHGIKFQAVLEAPGAGHRPGRGEKLERDLRLRRAAEKARRARAQLYSRPSARGGEKPTR